MSETVAGPPRAPRRPVTLLVVGALVGIALALAGLRRAPVGARRLPAGAVAVVNGAVIAGDDYARALAALARDRRAALTAADRARVLERLIDEELLVQRGLALGLAEMDRTVRAGLVDAVLAAVASDDDEDAATPEALARFYETERASFARPPRVHVRQIFVRVGDDPPAARVRIEAARARVLAGEALTVVAAAAGDVPAAPVPDGVITVATLQEYVGPTAVRAVLELAVGELTAPVRSGAGLHVLQLVARTESWVPPLAEIEDAVRAEYHRRAGERALQAYLADLRADAIVRRAPGLP